MGMRKNWRTKIVGSKVVLVPYQRKHVDKYHQWMKSEELQELTGSEPLSLEEEYAMQKSWREDEDKCTFIVLDKERLDRGDSEEQCMVGDTNLFLSQEEGGAKHAEAEIMIASLDARGKGFGLEAIKFMLRYGIEHLSVNQFSAKIKFGNTASEKLFEKLSFQPVSRSEVFQETTLEMVVNQEVKNRLRDTAPWTLEEIENSEE